MEGHRPKDHGMSQVQRESRPVYDKVGIKPYRSKFNNRKERDGMTKEEAIEFANSGKWQLMTLRERALFQLKEEKLCMPFDLFHEAVQKTIGRSVYTHEFARPDKLVQEIESGVTKEKTVEDIFSEMNEIRTPPQREQSDL